MKVRGAVGAVTVGTFGAVGAVGAIETTVGATTALVTGSLMAPVLLCTAGAAIVAAGGYFLYRAFKKSKDE